MFSAAVSKLMISVVGSATAKSMFVPVGPVNVPQVIATEVNIAVTSALAMFAAVASASGVTSLFTLKKPSCTVPLTTSSTVTSVTITSNPLPNVLGLFVLTVICASSLSSPPSFW